MLPTLIVVTAVLLGAIGLHADRHRKVVEVWLCNAFAAVLLAVTVAGHATGHLG
jgi:hypothetical protein